MSNDGTLPALPRAMLPIGLWSLVAASLAAAQATPDSFALGSLTAFSTSQASNLSNPFTFGLPASSNVSVSVALCSSASGTPTFTVSNSSDGSGGSPIALNDGFGSYIGALQNGAVLSVSNVGGVSFEVGVSDSGPMHQLLDSLPFLGDTTSNQALIFTPPFDPQTISQPSFPNYTLPPAELTQPSPPPNSLSPSNFTLILSETSPTSGSNLTNLRSLPQTGCALQAAPGVGTIVNQTTWQRDPEEGWRVEYLVEALQPVTNYTAYVVENGVKVSGPINLVTKSIAFSCPLLHNLPFCPTTAYAVPLPDPPSSQPIWDATTLPATVSDPLISVLTNFSIALLSTACGRDLYSPIVTCTDCFAAYRKWLCATQFPRCSEPAPVTTSASSATTTTTSAGLIQSIFGNSNGAQAPISALLPIPSSLASNASLARNPTLPPFPGGNYTVVLPCIETCTAADRACPVFLGFACPASPQFYGNTSYGFGFVDSATTNADGSTGGGVVQGKGITGTPQDRWGNVWCNGV